VGHLLTQILGGAVVIFGSAGAAFLTSRGSVRAAETQASVSAAAVEVDASDRLIQRLEARVQALHKDIEGCEAKGDELVERLDRAERSDKDNRRRVRALADQVGELRREHADLKRQLSLWRRYAIHLRGVLYDIGHHAPDPPAGISLDA
jgi:predicted RNase H-like nuclease (RuvC/YqgF family)